MHTYADNLIHLTMTELTANIAGKSDTDAVLGGVTASAVRLIDGIDYADVLVITGDRHQSLASTADVIRELDDLQWQLHDGPCLEAALAEPVIRCPDLRDERRWPRFSAAAVERGVRTGLSFQLRGHRTVRGALNLFGREARSFSLEAEAIGAMLATHTVNMLVAADRQHQFESALSTRDVIGQAKGVLMERFGVDAAQAFDMLRSLSQHNNTPLRQIATQVATSVRSRSTV